MNKIILFLFIFAAFRLTYSQEQEVLAILNLEAKGVNQKLIKAINGELIQRLSIDTQLLVLDEDITNTMLKEQGIDRTAACSNLQCFTGIGHLLAVSKVVGGSVTRSGKGPVTLELTLADVTGGSAIFEESVTATSMDILINDRIPRLTDAMLLSYNQWKQETAEDKNQTGDIVVKKKRGRPLIWLSLGALVAGGGVAAYFVSTKNESSPATNSSDEPEEISISDAPNRTRD